MAQGDERDKIQRQIDDLSERLDSNNSNLERLRERADAAETRADAAEARTDDLEARELVDREMIADLQAEGLLSRDHAEQMEEALRTSRTIGAAVGMIMATRLVGQNEAFKILRQASQRGNRKLRDLAYEVVETGKIAAVYKAP